MDNSLKKGLTLLSSHDYNSIWQETLSLLEQEMIRPSFETWIKVLYPLSYENGTFEIGTTRQIVKEWVETRYLSMIRKIMETVLGTPVLVKISLIPADAAHPLLEPSTPSIPSYQGSLSPAPANMSSKTTPMPLRSEEGHSPLNPKYTFDSFVIGNSNRFAHAASLAVAEMPAKVYNPFFIYGGVGLGKTHLMHAIGHRIMQIHPENKVLYISSEKFTNDFINAIMSGHPESFRNRYRSIDVLLIDDIQFLAKKEQTQEEFFHTFNALHEANKQIIISSDRPPKEIPTLEDRLRSRFEWGLTTDIQSPDLETRIAILRKKALLENITMPNDVIVYISTRIDNNIRELEGAFNRVNAFSFLNRKPITIELAMESLKDLFPKDKSSQVTPQRIQDIVAAHFRIKIEDLVSKRRTRNVTVPRQLAMYLCRELTDWSLPKIGEFFGGRDHTTVIHAYEKVNRERQEDSRIASLLTEISTKITNG
ncbi:MAG: chromosomal replication initiator protein DnaA [Negativicutes bacterium]